MPLCGNPPYALPVKQACRGRQFFDGSETGSTNVLSGQREAIIESGSPRLQASSATAAYPRKNKKPRCEHSPLSSPKPTRTPRSSKMSAQASTSTAKGFKPYWNEACKALQSQLWLPHVTASAAPPSHLSVGSSNFTEDVSSPWKKTTRPTASIPERCSLSLPRSAQATTESEPVVVSRKIRIYPKNAPKWFELLSLSRRAYNLAVEWLRAQERVDLRQQTEVRVRIRQQVATEYVSRAFVSVVADEAVNAAFKTFKACLRSWSQGRKAELGFRSRKDVTQSFVVQKLAASGIFPRVLEVSRVTEELPDGAVGSMATVVRRHGRWYLCVKKSSTVRLRENQARTVALDPGVRTFVSTFSATEAVKYGSGFAAAVLFPLLRKRDTLLGRRQKLLNVRCDSQWWRDQFRAVTNRLDRIAARIEDKVGDLHRRVAYDLVSRYDVIVCPAFETTQMVAKEGRRLRKSSVRQMQALQHYSFQRHLRWLCRKYGKDFVVCCEAYTSKTRSWDGAVHSTLGGATTISDGNIVVDRDYNGARGIFLRALTGQLSPNSDPSVTVGTD